MHVRGAERPHGGRVRGRDVADVRHEPVAGIEGVEAAHNAVTDDLRHDRSRCNGGALAVAVHDRAVRRRARAEPKAVDETRLRRRMQVCENGTEAGEIRAVEPGAVDLAVRHETHADLRRTAHDRVEERLALIVRELLRVVQVAERADAVAVQGGIVEEDARDDEGAGERAAPGLVGTRDEADAELSIVCEEPLAWWSGHPPRIDASSAGARGRAPSSPLSRASSRALRV